MKVPSPDVPLDTPQTGSPLKSDGPNPNPLAEDDICNFDISTIESSELDKIRQRMEDMLQVLHFGFM